MLLSHHRFGYVSNLMNHEKILAVRYIEQRIELGGSVQSNVYNNSKF